MELLTRLEEAILIAVLRLGDEAYAQSEEGYMPVRRAKIELPPL